MALLQKELKSDVARFTTRVQTSLAAKQVIASCGILTSDWPKLRESYAIHGSYATRQVCLGSVKRATCTDFVAKVELQSLLCNNFSQPATS